MFSVLMSSIICFIKIKFSEESLRIATSADGLIHFDYESTTADTHKISES